MMTPFLPPTVDVPPEAVPVVAADGANLPPVDTSPPALPGAPSPREGFTIRIRLPDGRIVRSDNLVGKPMLIAEAVERAGSTAYAMPLVRAGVNSGPIVLPTETYRTTGLDADEVAKRMADDPPGRLPGKRRGRSHRKRCALRVRLETQPKCPDCGCLLVIGVPGRRTGSPRTACFDPDGRMICAGCRSKQPIQRALAEARAAAMKAKAEAAEHWRNRKTPGPVFSHYRPEGR